MDIQKLKYFISVAECLNFTDAAVQAGVTQSAISQQISELEKKLNVQLIIRNKRPLELTWAGKVLLKEAYALLAVSNEIASKIEQAVKGISGFLKIGFLGGVEKAILPQAIREFHQKYSNIHITLQQYNWMKINEALMRGALDVGFTLSCQLHSFPDLVGHRLLSDVFCVAVNRQHVLAKKEKIDISELTNEPFVMFNQQADCLLHDLTYRICGESGFTPNVANYSQDLASLLFMVEAGVGVMVVPGPVREVAGPEICIIELSYPQRCFDVMLAWNRKHLNPAIPFFVKCFSGSHAALTGNTEMGSSHELRQYNCYGKQEVVGCLSSGL
ncbi:LysR family transcriptional regulator [Sporomusa termitida]|uniref:HTH-type transcriptional regulator GltC n=1 Tax=Sporomusa termitida TaxID=2377 RepID=A0A517DVR7_9FIRM|nr:LysR family transcriptional regulator [Sporomusa termitida]QDR81438.1 HTH-type transcriptional regulator GltC [Sporomusa termitida]